MHPSGSCKCLHCGVFFRPDARNRRRQRYCHREPCRQASKAASQRAWRRKPGNADYFKGSAHVARVQAWRQAHPGYWRRRERKRSRALQDLLSAQVVAPQAKASSDVSDALQEDWREQDPLVLGLICHLTGIALQDDIAAMTQALHSRGRAVLGIDVQGSAYAKTPDRSRAPPACAAAV